MLGGEIMAKFSKKVKLRKQRTELLVCIPVAIGQLMELDETNNVIVTYEDGKITIEKAE